MNTKENISYKHIIFGLYLIVLALNIYYHEFWGDELQSWNLAKGSTSFFGLLQNIRYEGHPPLWYILLYGLSKISHNPSGIKVLHYCIASLVAYILCYKSPFNSIVKLFVLFGYYFVYEYSAISRNYSIALLLIFSICIVLSANVKHQKRKYFILLFFSKYFNRK